MVSCMNHHQTTLMTSPQPSISDLTGMFDAVCVLSLLIFLARILPWLLNHVKNVKHICHNILGYCDGGWQIHHLLYMIKMHRLLILLFLQMVIPTTPMRCSMMNVISAAQLWLLIKLLDCECSVSMFISMFCFLSVEPWSTKSHMWLLWCIVLV